LKTAAHLPYEIVEALLRRIALFAEYGSEKRHDELQDRPSLD
jgi:hypothetical protein